MHIRIEEYLPHHVPAVKSFNSRLAAHRANSTVILSESAPQSAPSHASVHKEHYLALDGDKVCGGFLLQPWLFWVNGRLMQVGNYQAPISEGIINGAYASLGMIMLRFALRLYPHLFCLGMGGRQNRLPKMLAAMGWSLVDIPFFFRARRPVKVLRNIVPIRRTALHRLVINSAAFSGAGWLGIRILQARWFQASPTLAEPFSVFGPWADDLWERCKASLSLSATRVGAVLNLLYPSTGDRSLRLKMTRRGEAVGWVVMRDTQMRNHRYFGNLRVGTIVDGLALPEEIPAVITAATSYLEQRGVDLTISNQAHRAWVKGLRKCGFVRGPTNFILALSPKMIPLLEPLSTHFPQFHINRGDGDGPLDL